MERPVFNAFKEDGMYVYLWMNCPKWIVNIASPKLRSKTEIPGNVLQKLAKDLYDFCLKEKQQAEKHPLMYKGYIIRTRKDSSTNNERKFYAYSYRTDVFLNPIYDSWDNLKIVIDALKD